MCKINTCVCVCGEMMGEVIIVVYGGGGEMMRAHSGVEEINVSHKQNKHRRQQTGLMVD